VARCLNFLVDRALTDPAEAHTRAVLDHANPSSLQRLVDRIRRRATIVSKRHADRTRQILAVRDELVLRAYAHVLGTNVSAGWCDGSSVAIDGERSAGVGGLLMTPQGKIIARISSHAGRLDALKAEIAALDAVLREALERGIKRVVVHTDCTALTTMWKQRRGDPRIASVRALAREFQSMKLRCIPRRHNGPAHALAKSVALAVASASTHQADA
jgi:ribonuclease HI